MNTIAKVDLLAHAVARVKQHQGFMAYIFDRYQALEGITEIDLAEYLGCSLAAYYRLALCHTPNVHRHWTSQVDDIAPYGQASATKLAEVIRQVQASDLAIADPPH